MLGEVREKGKPIGGVESNRRLSFIPLGVGKLKVLDELIVGGGNFQDQLSLLSILGKFLGMADEDPGLKEFNLIRFIPSFFSFSFAAWFGRTR